MSFQGMERQKESVQIRDETSKPLLFLEMCLLFKMEETRTSRYHPESDGMVERMNRTLQEMLTKYVPDHQRDWDEHLSLVMMAYRSRVHASTQLTFLHSILPFVWP